MGDEDVSFKKRSCSLRLISCGMGPLLPFNAVTSTFKEETRAGSGPCHKALVVGRAGEGAT